MKNQFLIRRLMLFTAMVGLILAPPSQAEMSLREKMEAILDGKAKTESSGPAEGEETSEPAAADSPEEIVAQPEVVEETESEPATETVATEAPKPVQTKAAATTGLTQFASHPLLSVDPPTSSNRSENKHMDPSPYVFDPGPKANDRKGWLIQNFGPVGIGIMLEKDLVMKIHNVEQGSPADQTGKLEKGQIIESINGVKLEGTDDPRQVLAKFITVAEASDGKINLEIKGGSPVTVTIPVMGAYSPTWPMNCPKSDKIVRNLADLLAEHGKNEWSGMLFLLSTGEEKDLAVVRKWIQNGEKVGDINWSIGMAGLAFCEYYLRTGDESVLPTIQKGADHLRDTIYNGGWAGRGLGQYTYQSGGHVNASGVHCLTFLLLAKSCGVDVDEFTLQSSLRHFYRYSGRGSVPYGDYTSKAGYGDCNGKTSGLAMAMAAATRLTPDGENSIYAQAAQINAMKSYYGINVYHMGHTGGGLGEIWKSMSMGLMIDERPEQYRQYMDARQWILELSRRHTGAIGIGGGKEGNYDRAAAEDNKGIAWGTFFALNYTMPRKHLQLFGAPRSPYAKSYQLPERPWGNPADDAFSSPYPVPGGPWDESKVFEETLEEHVGYPAYQVLKDDDVSDWDIVKYLHHPEITHRFEAKAAAVRLKKDDFIMGLLSASDPRLQHVGVMALHDLYGTWDKRNADPGRVTDEMMKRVEELIRDPDGSWYVKQWALGLLQHQDVDYLKTYKDLLVQLVEHEEHWIQGSAISASTRLLMEKDCYKDLFPPIARAISKATAYSIVSRARFITEKLGDADPEIQKYGLELMKEVYQAQPDDMVGESGIAVVGGGGAFRRKAIGQVVGFSEAGMKFLESRPKFTSAWKASGSDADLYTYDGKFQGNPALTGTWGLVNHDQFASKSDAEDWLDKQLQNNKVPASRKEVKYGFEVDAGGGIKPIGFTGRAYEFPMHYAGDMAFSTFADKAYHIDVLTLGGREFLMFEVDFETEKDSGYKGLYKTYVKLDVE